MRVRVVFVLAGIGALATAAACTLNPQPLPPSDPDGPTAVGGESSSSGGFGQRGDDEGAGQSTDSPPAPANDGGDGGDAEADGGLGDASDDGNDGG